MDEMIEEFKEWNDKSKSKTVGSYDSETRTRSFRGSEGDNYYLLETEEVHLYGLSEMQTSYRVRLTDENDTLRFMRAIRGDQVITTEDPSKARKYRSLNYLFEIYAHKIKTRLKEPMKIEFEKLTTHFSKNEIYEVIGFPGEGNDEI